MEEKKGYAMRKGMGYLGNALKVTLGASAALGTAYLFSRVKEKQDTESSLARLEQMLSEISVTTDEQAKAPGRRKK